MVVQVTILKNRNQTSIPGLITAYTFLLADCFFCKILRMKTFSFMTDLLDKNTVPLDFVFGQGNSEQFWMQQKLLSGMDHLSIGLLLEGMVVGSHYL